MEDARRRNDTRTVYQCVGRLSGKSQNKAVNVRDSNGNLITNKTDKLNRWREHFSGFLNKTLTDPTKRNRLRNSNIRHPLMDLSDEPPSKNEIYDALKKMKKYNLMLLIL